MKAMKLKSEYYEFISKGTKRREIKLFDEKKIVNYLR